MTPEAAQRLLHAWPAWDESVRDARARLSYDPTWRPDVYPRATDHPYVRWEHIHEDPWEEAAAAVTRLGFSWLLMADYWIACFRSDYTTATLHLIRDFDRGGRLVRALPPADAFLEVSLDWRAGVDPRLRIEGPLALATPESIREAAERAVSLIHLRRDAALPHPVITSRRHGPLADHRTGRHRIAVQKRARAAELRSEGLLDKQIAHELKVTARTVGRWLGAKDRTSG